MGKIQIERTADGVVIRQYDGETLNEVTVPNGRPVEGLANWTAGFHPVGAIVTLGGDELEDFPSE